MSPTYRDSKRLRLRERAMAGVAARERKRMERSMAPETVEVGAVLLRGPVFGGFHCIRVFSRPDAGKYVWMEIDGRTVQARTARGARSAVARRIGRTVAP